MYRQPMVRRIEGDGQDHAPDQHRNERPNKNERPIEQEGQQPRRTASWMISSPDLVCRDALRAMVQFPAGLIDTHTDAVRGPIST